MKITMDLGTKDCLTTKSVNKDRNPTKMMKESRSKVSVVFRVSRQLRRRSQRPILPGSLRSVSCFMFHVRCLDAA